MFTRCRGLVLMMLVLLFAGCSPPPDKGVVEVCRNTAVHEALGHQLSDLDLGELVEECMASKGFELNENGKGCSSDLDSRGGRHAITETAFLAGCLKKSARFPTPSSPACPILVLKFRSPAMMNANGHSNPLKRPYHTIPPYKHMNIPSMPNTQRMSMILLFPASPSPFQFHSAFFYLPSADTAPCSAEGHLKRKL